MQEVAGQMPRHARRLLIADDQPALRKLVRAGVERDGWEVREASDGQEAWAILQSERVDVALLDVQMPQMGGPEVVRRALATGTLDAVHFILFTGRADLVDELQVALPQAAFLIKPFSFTTLWAALEGSAAAA